MKKRQKVLNSFFNALLLLSLVCCLAFGCGYHFRPVHSLTGLSLESIAIPLFSSTSSFAGFEGEFTRIVREEFIKHSKVRIEDKDTAQAVLSGRLHSIRTEPLSYKITQRTIHGFISTDVVTRSRILRVKAEAKLTDTKTGKIIWQDAALTDEASFKIGADPLRNEYSQRQALITIAQDLARQIYSRTMGRF